MSFIQNLEVFMSAYLDGLLAKIQQLPTPTPTDIVATVHSAVLEETKPLADQVALLATQLSNVQAGETTDASGVAILNQSIADLQAGIDALVTKLGAPVPATGTTTDTTAGAASS